MIKRHYRFVLIVSMLLMATLACSLGGKKGPKLGETIRSDAGGYELQRVSDYELEEMWGMVMMMPDDAQEEVGPFIFVYGELVEEDKSAQDILNEMQADASQGEFSKPKKTKVGGVEGLLAEFSGEEDGQALKGKVFVAVPYPKQEFYMTALAPEERWKELEPVFNAVLKSLSFFEAEPFDFDDWDWDDEDWDWDDEDWELDDADEIEATPLPASQVIRQWAVRAEASSEYSSDDYSAMQATGAPDVDYCEENLLAWAPEWPDTEESLTLYYETPVIPTELVIYQTHNPSQVVEIQFIDTTGEAWLLWYGDPEEVSTCPDEWTHTIDLEETFYTDTVVIWVDQSVLDLGWVEIDAVELVGYPMGSAVVAPAQDDSLGERPLSDSPDNYTGLMAGPVYQGYANVIMGETKEADLDRMMTIAGRESTDSWKPRDDHKQTYLYDMPWSGMTAYISVTTDGWVYKKNVNSSAHPDDYALSTVTWDNYEALKAIYDRDKVIPYEVMANLLQSPGFLREEILREDDGTIKSTYYWYNADGEVISGIFIDGKLTGMAGLSFFTP